MPRRWIRIAAFALLFVALGAATTTAVAWGLALRGPGRPVRSALRADEPPPPMGTVAETPIYHGGFVYWQAEHRFGQTTLRASKGEIGETRGDTCVLFIESSAGRVLSPSLVTIAKSPPDSRHLPREPAIECVEHRHGWPARSTWFLSQCNRRDLTNPPNCEGLFVYEPEGGRWARDFAYRGVQPRGPKFAFWLPIYILPLGFALDTLFYAAVWFVPLFGIRSARRAIRRRRGLCTRCAYDLKGLAPGSPCPECGHASAQAKASPTT